MLAVAGCGRQGPPQLDVSGEVTWQGQPVPAGIITFTPDVRQGNSGAQGVAKIRNGRYSTRDSGGRGAAPGPQVITVLGYDGQNPTDESPLGQMLFPEYQLERDLSESRSTLDIAIP
jgi:hypothetical protein